MADDDYEYEPPRVSFFFEYFLEPYVYSNIVLLFPTWIHPNVITICGGIFGLLSAAIVLWNSEVMSLPLLGEDAAPGTKEPKYSSIVAATFMLLYMICDNTDGKQARRTKSSSHVGEVLDHGIDMMVTTCGSIVVADSVNLSPPGVLFVTFSMLAAHFVNNWCHLITGRMSLGGRLLSVDEACIMCILMCYTRGIYGSEIFELPVFETLLGTMPVYAEKVLITVSDVLCDPVFSGTSMLTSSFVYVRNATYPELCLVSQPPIVRFKDLLVWGTIYGSWSDIIGKLIQTFAYAENKNKLEYALKTVAPFFAFSICYWGFMRCGIELWAPTFASFIYGMGALFCCIGSRLVFQRASKEPSVSDKQDMCYALVTSYITLSLLVASLLPPALPTGKYFGIFCGIMCFMTFNGSLKALNDSKGGKPMFRVGDGKAKKNN
eukprot:m.3704 g.3704  ORF g.3704 m.3704 type:complete len:434 (-) comp2814_c0_seq1:127-1428(-)